MFYKEGETGNVAAKEYLDNGFENVDIMGLFKSLAPIIQRNLKEKAIEAEISIEELLHDITEVSLAQDSKLFACRTVN